MTTSATAMTTGTTKRRMRTTEPMRPPNRRLSARRHSVMRARRSLPSAGASSAAGDTAGREEPVTTTALAILPSVSTELRALVERTRVTLEDAIPLNTRLAYDGDLRRFAAWCTSMRLAATPAEPETIVLYLRTGGGLLGGVLRCHPIGRERRASPGCNHCPAPSPPPLRRRGCAGGSSRAFRCFCERGPSARHNVRGSRYRFSRPGLSHRRLVGSDPPIGPSLVCVRLWRCTLLRRVLRSR